MTTDPTYVGVGPNGLSGAGADGATVNGRDAFLGSIARKLGRPAPLKTAPKVSATGVPEFYRDRAGTKDENIAAFIANWTALNGKVLVVKKEDAVEAIRGFLRQTITEHEVRRAARWEHPGLDALGLDSFLQEEGVGIVPWRTDVPAPDDAALAEAGTAEFAHNRGANWTLRSALLRATEACRMGIVWPDAAIANTGTLALVTRKGNGRSVSLVVDVLFAIFRADQLVTRMGEAFARIKQHYPDGAVLPSSIHLITGPSRSADIENDLTIGVHGPGKVYAVIIE